MVFLINPESHFPLFWTPDITIIYPSLETVTEFSKFQDSCNHEWEPLHPWNQA